MRRLFSLVVFVAVVFAGLLAAGMIQNRLPWTQPPGPGERIQTYLNTHVAETVEGSPFPELRPRHYEHLRPPELLADVQQAIGKLTGWHVVEHDPAHGALHAVVTTTLCRFHDDVRVRVEPDAAADGAVLLIRSESRVGKGDLGANTRHLLDLYAQLDAMVPPPPTAAYKTPPARTTPLF
jgi:uncharacterized protein (DUF1499 family)